jgi:hypothetical protein
MLGLMPSFSTWLSLSEPFSCVVRWRADEIIDRHPMEGKTNPIEDVGIRLAHGLHDLHLEENLAPAREAITRGLTTSSDSLWKTYTSVRTDLGKRQNEYRERREKERRENPNTSAPLDLAPPIVASTVLAGVDVARTGVTTVATGIGSFLSSSRKTLFTRTSSPDGSLPTAAEGSKRSSGSFVTPSTTQEPTTPSYTSFLRPLSGSSFGSTSSANTPPVTATTGGGFFSTFRRSFTDFSPTSTPKPTHEEELQVKDLDEEYIREIEARAAKDGQEWHEVVRDPGEGKGAKQPLLQEDVDHPS